MTMRRRHFAGQYHLVSTDECATGSPERIGPRISQDKIPAFRQRDVDQAASGFESRPGGRISPMSRKKIRAFLETHDRLPAIDPAWRQIERLDGFIELFQRCCRR